MAPLSAALADSFPSIDALPDDCANLLDAAAQRSFFLSRAWWRSVVQAGLPPGSQPRFVLFRDSQARPLGVLPLLAQQGAIGSLTNPYTCLYLPLLAPGLDAAGIAGFGEQVGRFCAAWPVVRLDGLPQDAAELEPLRQGLRRGGLLPRDFTQFGNWHAQTGGRDWAAYLASRPGALRSTIRRKQPRGDVTCEIVTGGDGLEAGIAAYEAVYAKSWKTAEPMADFNPAMMRHAAASGALRLGILRADGHPAAVQLWVVANRQAAVLKLAHDAAFDALSPGTVLTARMIRHMLEVDRVAELDFGRGDDPYKRLWVDARRQHVGLLLINPRRPAGLLALLRQTVSDLRARRAPPRTMDAPVAG